MNLVVDASVALKWFFSDQPGEVDIQAARALLPAIADGRIALVQPPHWIVEVIAVVARQTPHLVHETLSTVARIQVVTDASDAAYRRAADLSARLKQHVFDTLYHAVAFEHDAVLITADERYFVTARREGSIEMLANFKLA